MENTQNFLKLAKEFFLTKVGVSVMITAITLISLQSFYPFLIVSALCVWIIYAGEDVTFGRIATCLVLIFIVFKLSTKVDNYKYVNNQENWIHYRTLEITNDSLLGYYPVAPGDYKREDISFTIVDGEFITKEQNKLVRLNTATVSDKIELTEDNGQLYMCAKLSPTSNGRPAHVITKIKPKNK